MTHQIYAWFGSFLFFFEMLDELGLKDEFSVQIQDYISFLGHFAFATIRAPPEALF